MTSFTSPIPTIRPALPRDKADVAEFTKFIWDGHDYVGEVFPRWLEDPHGILLAAEYAGKCVGCAKVSLIASGQWWLEGFRVDPKFQDKRIGSRLDAACNQWWDEHGDGMLRLMTNSKRVKVHHLSETRGFVRAGEVCAYAAEPLTKATDAFTPLQPEEAEEAAALCQRWMPNGYLNIGWKFAAPNAEAMRAALQDESLFFWWRGRKGIVSAWEDDEEDGNRFIVGMEACAGEDRVQLLEDVRRLASARGSVVLRWMNIMSESILRDLDTAGYRKDWDDAAYLYERRHS
ncbi:MAG: GNAT family N-acetyltransferase [Anaerolineaceae bacterium]|nr:MAG: GNAT family N-acetyltransferase [Anaerolineaceae bacterium]